MTSGIPLLAARGGPNAAALGAGAGFRVLIVLLLFVAAIVLGHFAGKLAIDLLPALKQVQAAAALVLSCTVVLGVLLLLLGAVSMLRFVRCGFSAFRRALISLSPAILLFAIAGLAAAGISSPSNPPPAEDRQLGVLFGFGGRYDTIYVPFFPHEGRANGSCDVNHTFEKKYVSPASGIHEAIVQLGKSLASCSTADRHVTVDVVGFASNSEFARCNGAAPAGSADATVTDVLNHRLAEARRSAVVDLLNEGARRARAEFLARRGAAVVNHWVIDYEPDTAQVRWASRGQMQDDPQFAFNDREIVNGVAAYDTLRGGLTRRVDVVIKKKGACAL